MWESGLLGRLWHLWNRAARHDQQESTQPQHSLLAWTRLAREVVESSSQEWECGTGDRGQWWTWQHWKTMVWGGFSSPNDPMDFQDFGQSRFFLPDPRITGDGTSWISLTITQIFYPCVGRTRSRAAGQLQKSLFWDRGMSVHLDAAGLLFAPCSWLQDLGIQGSF